MNQRSAAPSSCPTVAAAESTKAAPDRAFESILITGAGGFVGGFVRELAVREFPGARLVCAYHEPEPPVSSAPSRMEFLALDLLDRKNVRSVVQSSRPDAVVHLAGWSNVQDSWQHAETVYRINVMGTLTLLQELAALDRPCRFLNIGSGDIYGTIAPSDLPIDESLTPRPSNPYSASKYAAEIVALQHDLSDDSLECILLRPFAHTGPGQVADFVCPAFARQVALIEAGRQEPVVSVGNLETRRDLTDVRDMARAYLMALRRAPAGVPLNVASGTSRRIRSVLDHLIGLSRIDIDVRIDPARLRPVDTPELRCEARAFREATGWQPQIPFEQTLADVLGWWRDHVPTASSVS